MTVVPSDGELTYADHVGRFYARRYGMAPMVGRLLGYLSVCDPQEQTIAELADALLAGRSAIAGAVSKLEILALIRRSHAAGERIGAECGSTCPRPTRWASIRREFQNGELTKRTRHVAGAGSTHGRVLEDDAFAEFCRPAHPGDDNGGSPRHGGNPSSPANSLADPVTQKGG